MGTKMNSVALRIGINKTWTSHWFAKRGEFADYLMEDIKIRDFVRGKLSHAGLDSIIIERPAGKLIVEASVAKPGVAIGRQGAGIEELKKSISDMVGKAVDLRIKEYGNADLSARIVGQEIANGINKRQAPKLLAKLFMKKAMQAGAKGIMVWVSGRIRGHKDARRLKFTEGSVPLQTLRVNLDYALVTTQYPGAGTTSVKVWINR
ncbi:30S ribosomal protein S3 [Candidatus Dojkabacteria bacterium]|nr:30S ribosomal protein S3 [Candidatus Dojkabacteria bacterium]